MIIKIFTEKFPWLEFTFLTHMDTSSYALLSPKPVSKESVDQGNTTVILKSGKLVGNRGDF
jgi:hypothetical protein